MEFEHKAFIPGCEVKVLDEQLGVVEAIVAVTNIEDKVKDIILPGAFTKSLAERSMKGMRGHDWNRTVAKTLEQKELRPGDPALPPKILALGGGALVVKAQYNMSTEAGRDAFADIKFFGEDAEFSIGYRVNPAETKTDRQTGVRRIGEMEVHEFSDVPFGAMPLTHALSVKSLLEAQEDEAKADEKAEETFSVGPFEGLTIEEVAQIKERARAAAATVAFERTADGKALVPAIVHGGVCFTTERIIGAVEQGEKGESIVLDGKDIDLEALAAGMDALDGLIAAKLAEKNRPQLLESKDGRIEGSWEDDQDDIRAAVAAWAAGKYGAGTTAYLVATFDDHVVACVYPGPGSNYVDTDDGDGDITLSFPYTFDPATDEATLGDPTEVEITSSVDVVAKALRERLESKAGAVLRGTNADHLSTAILHLVSIAKSAGMSIKDLVADIEEDYGDNGSDEASESDGKKDEPEAVEAKAGYKVTKNDDQKMPFAVTDEHGNVKAKHPTHARAQSHADRLNGGKADDEPVETDVLLSDAELLEFEHLRFLQGA